MQTVCDGSLFTVICATNLRKKPRSPVAVLPPWWRNGDHGKSPCGADIGGHAMGM
jgi:hypothetical protein